MEARFLECPCVWLQSTAATPSSSVVFAVAVGEAVSLLQCPLAKQGGGMKRKSRKTASEMIKGLETLLVQIECCTQFI